MSWRLPASALGIVVAAALTGACRREAAQQTSSASTAPVASAGPAAGAPNESRTPAPSRSQRTVQMQMRNVSLRAEEGVTLQIDRLRGEMITRSGEAPVFDDQSSYTLQIITAVVSIDMASLQTLIRRHASGGNGPLTELRVEADGDRLKMSGKLHKGIAVPFSARATIAAGGEGTVRLHVESLETAGVPAKGLLGFFGVELGDLVKLRETNGVQIEENDITIDPSRLLPPPRMRGTLSKVAIVGGRLVETFDDGSAANAAALMPPAPSGNYIYFGHGDISFGKLTMHDADLQLIDQDPRDPFDFYPAKYSAQLVAGYSKNTPAQGLMTFMPDYGDLSTRAAGRAPRRR